MAIGVPMLNKEKLNQSKVLQLVDWQFNRYLSMQLLPLLYLLMIIGAVLLVGFFVAASFSSSLWFGLATATLSPLILLVMVAIVRAALEYLVMAHRSLRIVESMRTLPERVESLDNKVDALNEHVIDLHEMLMQLRPLLTYTLSAIRSRYFSQSSTVSSPRTILLNPGPCAETFGLPRYWSTVAVPPKMTDRSQDSSTAPPSSGPFS